MSVFFSVFASLPSRLAAVRAAALAPAVVLAACASAPPVAWPTDPEVDAVAGMAAAVQPTDWVQTGWQHWTLPGKQATLYR
ncbi:MAG: hypothetical protein ACK5RC_15025, partial [Curvibacter sp.]